MVTLFFMTLCTIKPLLTASGSNWRLSRLVTIYFILSLICINQDIIPERWGCACTFGGLPFNFLISFSIRTPRFMRPCCWSVVGRAWGRRRRSKRYWQRSHLVIRTKGSYWGSLSRHFWGISSWHGRFVAESAFSPTFSSWSVSKGNPQLWSV